MASLYSFDIVSTFDEQELKNAIDQARREIQQRFDLKDTKTEVVLGEQTITMTTDSEFTLKQVTDLLESKAVRQDRASRIRPCPPGHYAQAGNPGGSRAEDQQAHSR